MSFGLQIKVELISGDPAAARRFLAAVQPAAINPIIGRSAVNLFRDHFFKLNAERPNKLGGKRTQFYGDAARGTSATVLPDGALVSVNQVGIRQRWKGGTIRPGPGKQWITIPARTESYGKSAPEFNDLRFVLFRKNNNPLAALVRNESTKLKRKRDRKTGEVSLVSAGEQGGEILYWLKKSVTQRPDPSVVPLPDVIYGRLFADIGGYLDRAIAGRPGTGGQPPLTIDV
jgi:hypothetical protein